MIVEATLPLLLEHGEMVTTRQIAEAAGIAEGTIFRVFADKDELIARRHRRGARHRAARTGARRHRRRPRRSRTALAAAVAILQQRVVDIWRLVSSVGTRFHDAGPAPDDRQRRARARCSSRTATGSPSSRCVAARLLRALTLSTTHPMLVGEPMSPAEIVRVLPRTASATGREPC